MNPVVFALRHPVTVMVALAALLCGGVLAVSSMKKDIFPNLNLPVIYIAQPYGGMDPSQMEGLITNYYEYYSLYLTGIHHVESKNIQGVAQIALHFHPGTDMVQAMSEVVTTVNRAKAFMPPGTVPPFVMRFDAGSVPVGYLVFSSDTRSVGEIQDQAVFKVRPMFASLPGVSAPPPLGGSQRTIVVRVDPVALQGHNLSPQEVTTALTAGNAISPSGNIRVGDDMPIVAVNSMADRPVDFGKIPLRLGKNVFLHDLATVSDSTDIPTGYALVNGKRAVYILVTKRADASTLDVVNEVKAALPRMQAVLPEDIEVRFEFDQSPHVSHAIRGVCTEGLLGAILTGLMVLLFLRDWRSVIVVVLNIPLALLGALLALWLCGHTVNLMTLGGLALAVGILVDEATVEVENIHSQMEHTPSVARSVRLGNAETAVPRLLAMLCVLAVFIPSFFMQGAAHALFVPLSLAVGFSMITSYLLSSTFVPVMSVWLLRHHRPAGHLASGPSWFGRLQAGYAHALRWALRYRVAVIPAFLTCGGLALWLAGRQLGTEIFPATDSGQLRLRLRAPTGTRIERTEQIAERALQEVKDMVGEENVGTSLGYVGTVPSGNPINTIYQWMSGPHEALLWVALKPGGGVRTSALKERLRDELASRLEAHGMKGVRVSFEPADIVNEVMSFGSPTPVEVVVSGPSLAANHAYAEKVRQQLVGIPSLRDLQFEQPLDYPTVDVKVDRQKAGLSGVTVEDVARSLVTATSSSRFVVPNFWRDPDTGIGYQVQVEIPPERMNATEKIGLVPIRNTSQARLMLRDVADIQGGIMPGRYDRYNLRRLVSLTANVEGEDLGRVAGRIERELKAVGPPPRGMSVDIRGQVAPMRQMFRGLGLGLGLAVAVIFFLLTAYFQSPRLALVVVSTAPAVLAGVALALLVTGTTLNIQSFMGAIMAVGVAVANAILLATFAERSRRSGADAVTAALEGARHRLRPILMTSCAMIAGMLPMALGLGDGGEQTAPLGRAVVGGLLAATLTTLLVLPAVFAVVQGRSATRSVSLDPDDPQSSHFDRATDGRTVPGRDGSAGMVGA